MTSSQLATSSSTSAEYSETVPGAPLEAVLCSDELATRPSRPPDAYRQDTAVNALLDGLTSSPATVLQSLADTILKALHCDSAGVSLINDDGSRFYWPAIAGVWAPHIGGGTPLNFGPCGDVLNAKCSLHMREVHKRYTYFTPVPWVKEVLLVPFHVHGKVMGTIWAVIHEPPHNQHSSARNPREYDREDLRLLEVIGGLASAAYQVWIRTHDSAGP